VLLLPPPPPPSPPRYTIPPPLPVSFPPPSPPPVLELYDGINVLNQLSSGVERGLVFYTHIENKWYNECSVYTFEKSRIVTSPLCAPMATFCPQQAMCPPCPRLCGSQHIRRGLPSSARRDNHPVLSSNSKAVLLPFGYKIISVVE
jgi:hypothetical protein